MSKESWTRTDGGTVDDVFEAVSHQYRRRLLGELLECDPDDIDVVRIPNDIQDGEMDSESLEIELHHVHLPKLKEAGFIEWDIDNQVVRGPKFEAIEPVLESLDKTNER